MSFRIEGVEPKELAYAIFCGNIRHAILQTWEEEYEARGLTLAMIAETLGLSEAALVDMLDGRALDLRTISNLYSAMDREPLSNFEVPEPREHVGTLEALVDPSWSDDYKAGLEAGGPEIERLRDVLRAIRDEPDRYADLRNMANNGLMGE